MRRADRKCVGQLTLALGPGTLPHTRAVLREILEHAGFFVRETSLADLPSVLAESRPQVLLLGGRINAQAAEPIYRSLEAFVAGGGGVIGLGGSGAPRGQDGNGVIDGLFPLFGLRPALNEFYVLPGAGQSPWRTLGEGWLSVRAPRHPMLAGLEDVPLHYFGGQAVLPARTARGSRLRILAELEGEDGRRNGQVGISELSRGRGLAVFLAPDLAGSVAYIRTGRPVVADAISASDGTAPVSDGLLKAEDGLVLNFNRDRRLLDDRSGRLTTRREAGVCPAFDQPIADALAQLLIRAICHVAVRTGVRLPRLWYHPDGLEAVGHFTHDSDGNELNLAEKLYQVMKRGQVRSTWCIQHPGYGSRFYRKLKSFGHEIALHYDAMGYPEEDRFRRWGRKNFIYQARWLKKAARLNGSPGLMTNNNHYTRWEGWMDLLEWCAACGIQADQSRSGSKRGTTGYPFGSAHCHFLYRPQGTRVDTLVLPFQTMDLKFYAPVCWGPLYIDRALRWNGLVHYVFHPAHIARPGVAQALLATIRYGQRKGVRWLPAAEITTFERARRACVAEPIRFQVNGSAVLKAGRPLVGATLMLLGRGPAGIRPAGANKSAKVGPVFREGFWWSSATLKSLSKEAILSIGDAPENKNRKTVPSAMKRLVRRSPLSALMQRRGVKRRSLTGTARLVRR